ncbi:MAG TPA: NADH-quinone oxidoreductase subunit J [Bryobacteraceae bacterium]|jgi:NADH-quinone oxidoreductase subunit J|nr:NADH-quinone oxidoreductase subunit J [Bryobacteraceae bacterium]
MDAILFLLFAAIAVICAVNLVLQTHPISSALSLVGVMGALALLYLQLGGEFIAAAQLIVYAGAIMVLFIFVIMLLNAGKERKLPRKLWVTFAGVPLLAGFIAIAAFVIHRMLPVTEGVKFGSMTHGSPQEIGRSLFQTYLLPFEVTSVLILIAILGAVVLASKEIE